LILFRYRLQYIVGSIKKEIHMKKLLMATLMIVLAALTETPDDYILGGRSDASQVDAYLSVWANAEAEGVIAEDMDSIEPFGEVGTDQMVIDKDANIAI
jgi:hypothetical protein